MKRQYETRQSEFIKWCKKQFYFKKLGKTVIESRMISFLKQEVIDRPYKKRGRRKKTVEVEAGEQGKEKGEGEENDEDESAEVMARRRKVMQTLKKRNSLMKLSRLLRKEVEVQSRKLDLKPSKAIEDLYYQQEAMD